MSPPEGVVTHPPAVSPPPQSPWAVAAAAPAATSCSLADVMSEQLARQLEEEEGVALPAR